MFLSTDPLWKICMKYRHVSLLCGWMIVAPSLLHSLVKHFRIKPGRIANISQKYFTQLFGTTKTFMLFKNRCICKKISMTCMLTLDFHANKLLLLGSCTETLGMNGFKFPAKGSLPVILGSPP